MATDDFDRMAHIKSRNVLVQIILFIFTLSLYSSYWYFVTLNELRQANTGEGDPRTAMKWISMEGLGLLVPFISPFSKTHYIAEYERFLGREQLNLPKAVAIRYGSFLSPILWFVVQRDLNRAARQSAEHLDEFSYERRAKW